MESKTTKVKIELLKNEFYYTKFCHDKELENAIKLLNFYGIIKYEITEKDIYIIK